MYHAFWWHALFVRDHLFSVKIFDRSRSGCQLDWGRETIRAWAFRVGAPSPLASLPLARSFFLAPATQATVKWPIEHDVATAIVNT